jgi:hypothetical protein
MSQVVNEKDANEKVVSERGTGGATFAAVVMIIGGTFGFFEGLSLIVGGTYYVQPANYWISTSAATWGWWHLIVGLIVLAAGFGVTRGAAWARWLGIIFVSIQALTNFLFIPAQPFLGDHPHPDRLVDHSLPVRSPTRARLTLRAADLAHSLIHHGLSDRRQLSAG